MMPPPFFSQDIRLLQSLPTLVVVEGCESDQSSGVIFATATLQTIPSHASTEIRIIGSLEALFPPSVKAPVLSLRLILWTARLQAEYEHPKAYVPGGTYPNMNFPSTSVLACNSKGTELSNVSALPFNRMAWSRTTIPSSGVCTDTCALAVQAKRLAASTKSDNRRFFIDKLRTLTAHSLNSSAGLARTTESPDDSLG